MDRFLADEAHTEQGNFNNTRRMLYLKPELDAHRLFYPGLLLTYEPCLFSVLLEGQPAFPKAMGCSLFKSTQDFIHT